MNERAWDARGGRPAARRNWAARLKGYGVLSLLIVLAELWVLGSLEQSLQRHARFESREVLPPVVSAHWQLPAGIAPRSIAVSFDGRYAAYPMGEAGGGPLEVVDLGQRRVQSELPLQGKQVNLLRWLPDREQLLYAVGRQGGSGDLELWSLDADSGRNRLLHTIRRVTAASRVVDLSLSTLTNLIYIKVCDGPGQYRLYRLDVMDYLYRARFQPEAGRVDVLPARDEVLVEAAVSGQVWAVRGILGTDRTQIGGPGGPGGTALLGVTSADEVYLGDLSADGRRVIAVRFGPVGGVYRPVWHGLPGLPRDRLFVAQDDTLYLNEPQSGTLVGIAGLRRTLHYRGELVTFTGRLLAVRSGRTLSVGPVS
ncbi:MAG: hypothetical protein IMW99_10850 [Firmicutes bacterium]|nr:hypothetical protein [Bacillota bacterium]